MSMTVAVTRCMNMRIHFSRFTHEHSWFRAQR